MVRQTSVEAFLAIKEEGLLNKMRFQTYELLYEHGPLTAGELYQTAKLHMPNEPFRNNFWKRLSELRRLGVVQELGTTVCKVTGRKVILLDVTANLPSKLLQVETVKSKYLRAVSRLGEYIKTFGPIQREDEEFLR